MTDETPTPIANPWRWAPPSVALLGVMFGVSAWAYQHLPPRLVVRNFFVAEQAKLHEASQIAFLTPGIAAVMLLAGVLVTLWRSHTAAARAAGPGATRAMWAVVLRLDTIAIAMLLTIHCFMLAAALGWLTELAGLRGAGIAFGIGYALFGNYLPLAVMPIPVVGLRGWKIGTDPARWRATQRLAGYGLVGAGLAIALLAAVAPLVAATMLIPLTMLGLLVPSILERMNRRTS